MALRGFVKCTDGRLYHPVIAAEAIKAMARREEHQAAKDGDSERKREEREDRKLLFAVLREMGLILPAKGTSTSHLREVAASRGISIVVTEGHKVVTVTSNGSHRESHGGVTAKTGTGTYVKEQAAAASLTHAAAVEKARDDATKHTAIAVADAVALALSATGCSPMSTRWLAPQSIAIPSLPSEARQEPLPSICSPTCSAALAIELQSLQELRTARALPD